jgi:uncharacterized protein (DUF1800 family)
MNYSDKHFKQTSRILMCLACAGALTAASIAAFAQGSPVVNTGWNSGTSTSLQAAGRILNQASFGPTITDAQNVENIGISNYINQQFAQPAYQIPLVNSAPGTIGDCPTMECPTEFYWWNDILFGQDQLRQRVAFELSKLFVVSTDAVDPRYMPNYMNVLSNDAFSNWFTLMHDVALSPAMGTYLNLANSTAPSNGQHAGENFARELMQLFSIGTVALNQDGSAKLDGGGSPIPNYTADQVQNFALAYTGWTFARPDCSMPSQAQFYWYPLPPGQNCTLMPLSGAHSTVSKTLLRGTVLPAGQSAQDDMTAALQNIFNDPSLPPFVSRHLIQNLVKSNPTPAYISRVAGTFTNNGSGVRGDMKSVLRAILLDPEARAGDSLGAADPNAGKLRDPMLWWASVMRAMQATSSGSIPNVGLYEHIWSVWLSNMDEQPRAEGSVFSYYSPDYQVAGTGLYAPEFQNENVQTVVWMALHVQDALYNNFNVTAPQANEFTLNLGPGSLWYNCAAQWGPTNLVNVLDALLMHGTMTQDMQQSIVNAIKYDDTATMVRAAVYLIVTSPQYRVMV